MNDYTLQIHLSNSFIAVVDQIDADLVQFKWQPLVTKGRCYAVRNVKRDGKFFKSYLHRIVIERAIGRVLNKGEKVDHRDNNPLNNSRSNLRVSTHSQNICNSKKPTTNTSGYKGVSPSGNKWRATIRLNGKAKHLGMFQNLEDAYAAYCEAALKYHGEFARFQ